MRARGVAARLRSGTGRNVKVYLAGALVKTPDPGKPAQLRAPSILAKVGTGKHRHYQPWEQAAVSDVLDPSKPNPYQSPASRVADDEVLAMVPAERWRRFVNLLVDYFGFFLLSLVIGLLIGVFGGAAAVRRLQETPNILVGVVILTIYYVPLELLFGRTLGKLVTGTRVVNEQGGKPSVGQVFGRTFARFIPFEAFSFFSADARGWHDSLSKTYVVKVR
jgi:uncharacterized RDD family membrane protein YckC